jgi:hypothetical protein
MLEEDPFASGNVLESGNSMPADLPPPNPGSGTTGRQHGLGLDENLSAREAYGLPEEGAGKKKRKKPDDHNNRVKQEMERHGYFVFKTEAYHHGRGPRGEQAVWKTDLLNFMDYQALKSGQTGVTAVQACAKDQVKPHLRKFRDIPEVRLWLECGNRLLIVGAYQEGGKGSRWRFEITKVTTELLDEYEARKRGAPAKEGRK